MAAKDVVATAMAALQGVLVPSTAVQDLMTQRDALYAQAATLQAQIDAAVGADGPNARQAMQALRQLAQRGGGQGPGGQNGLAGGVVLTQPLVSGPVVLNPSV